MEGAPPIDSAAGSSNANLGSTVPTRLGVETSEQPASDSKSCIELSWLKSPSQAVPILRDAHPPLSKQISNGRVPQQVSSSSQRVTIHSISRAPKRDGGGSLIRSMSSNSSIGSPL